MVGTRPSGRMRNAAGWIPPGLQALVLYTILIGNQWVTAILWDWDRSVLVRVATFPVWEIIPYDQWSSPYYSWEPPWLVWWALNLHTIAFLGLTAVFLRWARKRGSTTGRSRGFLRGFAAGFAATLAAGLLRDALMNWFGDGYFSWAETLLGGALTGVFFGLLVGFFQRERRLGRKAFSAGHPLNNAAEDRSATRYLCVAAYTDETFADRVVGELFENNLRAVAFSPGTDVWAVVNYCLSARRRRQGRDLKLAAVTGATLALSFISAWFLIPGLLLLYTLIVVDIQAARRFVSEHLSARAWNPVPAESEVPQRWLAERLSGIQLAQRGNVAVYSGFNPFVGYGDVVTGWSFTIPLVAAQHHDSSGKTKAVSAFTVVELIAAVRAHLREAAGSSQRPGHEQLAGAVVKDRVFVCGNGLDGDRRFLPDRRRPPRVFLSEEELNQVALFPTGTARHYLCIHVPSWGGEVVASTFLHLSADERMLHLECSRTVLGPVRGSYHDIDRYPKTILDPDAPRLQLLRNPYLDAAIKLVPLALGSPLRAIGRVMFASGGEERTREAVEMAQADLAYDYGANMSVRELVVDPRYHNFFQKLDVEKHLKITEAHVLGVILDFLDDHGVDTTEFRNRQMMLLNQGIIQSGGVSIVGNQAVGREATATQRIGQLAGQLAGGREPRA